MPEIVELRIDADQLDFLLSDRKLIDIELLSEKFAKKCLGIEEVKKSLPLQIIAVKSRAKKLFVECMDKSGKPWWIIFYYGMTGGITTDETESNRHIGFKVSEHWVGFNVFYYRDFRRLGKFTATSDLEVYKKEVTDMSPPFVLGYKDNDFAVLTKEAYLLAFKELKKSKSKVVNKLSDQRSIGSGIGQYLCCEIFYEAKLSPFVLCSEITDKQIQDLWEAINKIIMFSYKNGGTSIRDYVHPMGESGNNQNYLKVYGRKGNIEGRKIKTCKIPSGRTFYYVDWSGENQAE